MSLPNLKKKKNLTERGNICVRVSWSLVLSTTSGVLYLWVILKLILGEWQSFLCVPSQSFYEQGNLPYPFSVLINNKDEWGALLFGIQLYDIGKGQFGCWHQACSMPKKNDSVRALALKIASQKAW